MGPISDNERKRNEEGIPRIKEELRKEKIQGLTPRRI